MTPNKTFISKFPSKNRRSEICRGQRLLIVCFPKKINPFLNGLPILIFIQIAGFWLFEKRNTTDGDH